MGTNFSQMSPSDILKDTAIEKFKHEMRYFHEKLTLLHHFVYFMQQIVDFPHGLFIRPGSDFFLDLVVWTFHRMAILEITKLTTDGGSDARTLFQFKNFMAQAVKDEFSRDYREILANARFDPRMRGLINRAKTLRNTQIAHSVAPDPNSPVTSLSLDEIAEIVQELTKLYEVASFDTEYRYLLLSYDPTVKHPAGSDSTPDIERILDRIAKESGVLDLPEDRHERWQYRRTTWSEKTLNDFNRYRKKFDLPEA